MKSLKHLAAIAMLSFAAQAQQTDSQASTNYPPKDIVIDLYDYCASQMTEMDITEAEAFLLDCVNQDLKAQAYATFSDYMSLMEFIDADQESP